MIDLHSHTTCSDGSFSVKEIMAEAERVGLSLLSITDHDTIRAYEELKKTNIRNIFSGNIISGVEMTTSYEGEIIEVLGYCFDLDVIETYIKSNFLTSAEKNLKEYELIKQQYKKVGVVFDEDNINFDYQKESCRKAFWNEIKNYSENHKFFLSNESLSVHSSFTRNEIYNPKSPLYVDESALYPSLEKTIDIIHKSGGLAFLAHTYVYSPTIANNLLTIINDYDLDGLECFYPTFTEEQSNYLVKLCKKKGLFMCGGSDFHGITRVNHSLGLGNNNLNINELIVQNWVN